MIAMFLYPDSTIYEGGKEMLRILETGLPFRAEEYIKGLGISEISDNTGMLWARVRWIFCKSTARNIQPT